jgi:hypothetical protein
VPNYGEDFAYWYLRLNGFFPLTNFVVHRRGNLAHSGDVDLVAVRPPNVYEAVGGGPEDWDPLLTPIIDFSKPAGIVCEVKTGQYVAKRLFPRAKLEYAVGRLGLVPRERIEVVTQGIRERPSIAISGRFSITKMLIADHLKPGPFVGISLDHVKAFLKERVARYPKDKYRDRLFFQDGVFQLLASEAPRRKEKSSKR